MNKSTETVIKFVSLVLVLVLLGFCGWYVFLFVRCFSDAEKIPDVPRFAVMRVLYYGSSGDTVSARFVMYDTSGKECAIIDRSWPGEALSVDFTSAAFGGRELLFPFRIYSGQDGWRGTPGIRHGTSLPKFYMDDRQCYLLGARYTDAERRALYSLGAFALWQATKFQSSYSKIYTLDLAGLEAGQTYEIITDFSGFLRLVQM